MSTRVVERVDDWDQESFSGGYHALQERADAGFSGVFRAEGAELYMTRGTAVGIRRGAIEDFEGASGTVFTAPTDALPLLAIMQEESDEVRAKYYTEDTSIREVDGTLEDGGFTGFVELSENVLSGDYYLVYHRGNSMSVGFVGNTQRLITGDEAFETTDDEVGIYEVRPVDIEPIEIPEPVEPEPDPEPEPREAAGAGAQETAESDSAASDSADPLASQSAAETAESVPSEPETGDTAQPPAQQSATDTGTGEASDGAADADAAEPEPSTAPADTTAESASPEQAGTDDEPRDNTTIPAGDVDEAEEESSTAGRAADAAAGASLDTASTPEGRGTAGERADTDSATDSETGGPSPTPDQGQTRSDNDTGTTAAERRRASESLTEPAGSETDADTRTDTIQPDERSVSTEDARSQAETSGASTRETDAGETRQPSTSAQPDSTPGSTGAGQSATPRADDEQQTATADQGRDATPEHPAQLETRAIPSLDPERTNSQSNSSEHSRRDTPGRAEATATATAASQHPQPSTEQETGETEQTSAEESATAAETAPSDTETVETTETTADETDPEQTDNEVAERIEELEELLEDRETELKTLESDLHSAESERDSLRRELEQVRSERDDLQEEVEKLESELHRLEEELGAATDAQQRMTPQEALSGTDLFVRYDSKGDATLAKARDSGLRQQDVAGNLQLEKHTQFEADVAAVGGREYGEFLEDTVAYKFAHWVVYDLLFEIQSTGHTETLSDLYKALPKINRIELNGVVNATYAEDGEQVQSSETFDVVFRERMGDPLLVANINESRQGASKDMMDQLITAAERVGQTSDQFAAAFLVTESFFEPEALETVEESTRGGLLSRDKRKSYVNLSRKNGYHLCLVEARNENFHLEVPEL